MRVKGFTQLIRRTGMVVKRFIEKLDNICTYVIDRIVSVKGHTALFKLSLIAFTYYFSSLVTLGTIILPIESKANQSLHSVEKELGKNLTFEELDCKIEMETYSACKMAIYNGSLSEMSIYTLVNVQYISLTIGFITFVLSIIGFCTYPISIKKKENEKTPNNGVFAVVLYRK